MARSCAEVEKRRGEMKEASGSPEVSIDSAATCTYSRLIDNTVTRAGKWTGQVVCRECGARFDDPYRELK